MDEDCHVPTDGGYESSENRFFHLGGTMPQPRFDETTIALARRLKSLGLPWEPRPGHFVFDDTRLIEPPSPFQDGVYFILDMKHFLRRTGTPDRLKELFTWLPTWEDARNVLSEMGFSHRQVAERLRHTGSLESGKELPDLLQWIAEEISKGRR